MISMEYLWNIVLKYSMNSKGSVPLTLGKVFSLPCGVMPCLVCPNGNGLCYVNFPSQTGHIIQFNMTGYKMPWITEYGGHKWSAAVVSRVFFFMHDGFLRNNGGFSMIVPTKVTTKSPFLIATYPQLNFPWWPYTLDSFRNIFFPLLWQV